MKIKYMLIDEGLVPMKKTAGAACFDCYSNEDVIIQDGETRIVKLGFAVEVPEGFYMEIRGRSGLSSKGMQVAIGTVDSDYRGEVGAIVTNLTGTEQRVIKGERIAQAMVKEVLPVELVQVSELSDTDRGSKGFGSTGR